MRDVSLVVFFFYHSELYEQNTVGFVVDAKRGIQRTWTERKEASCAVRDKRIPLRRMSILYPAKLKENKMCRIRTVRCVGRLFSFSN